MLLLPSPSHYWCNALLLLTRYDAPPGIALQRFRVVPKAVQIFLHPQACQALLPVHHETLKNRTVSLSCALSFCLIRICLFFAVQRLHLAVFNTLPIRMSNHFHLLPDFIIRFARFINPCIEAAHPRKTQQYRHFSFLGDLRNFRTAMRRACERSGAQGSFSKCLIAVPNSQTSPRSNSERKSCRPPKGQRTESTHV